MIETPHFVLTQEFREEHHLIDRMDETPAVNELRCSCGARLLPDCDISSRSVSDEFERHLVEDTECTREALDEWIAVNV